MQEHDLIRTPFEVIYLGGADFSGADLKAANLTNTNLISVNFSGADRRGASFSAFQGTGEDILRASSEGVSDLFMKPVNTSRLDLVSLRGAKLADAILAGCMLIKADFEGADLERTDLRGADLRIARNLTQEQIEQAYGGASQRQPAQNTSLPDHLRAPAAWSKPIWEQKQGCGEA